jgi:hypothetical protein
VLKDDPFASRLRSTPSDRDRYAQLGGTRYFLTATAARAANRTTVPDQAHPGLFPHNIHTRRPASVRGVWNGQQRTRTDPRQRRRRLMTSGPDHLTAPHQRRQRIRDDSAGPICTAVEGGYQPSALPPQRTGHPTTPRAVMPKIHPRCAGWY